MSQPRIVPLSKTRHAALTFSPLEDYSFTAAMNSMPLLGFEVVEASRCFAIAFPAAGSAVPHALLGLGGKNIFVDARGRWTAPYLPLYAANHPFSLIAARFPEQEKMPGIVLAVDEDSPHFRRKDGLPLYGEDGEPLEFLQRITVTLGNQHQRHRDSEQALAELGLSGVLAEQNVTIRADGKARAVSGLRVAGRDKVMALSDATLSRWARNGLLEILFAHWRSMRHLQALLDDPSCPAPNPARVGGRKA